VPFKVAKNIISQSRDEEGSMWGQLAGCLVMGFGQAAGIDSGTSEVIGGVIQGVTGNSSNNCKGTATTQNDNFGGGGVNNSNGSFQK